LPHELPLIAGPRLLDSFFSVTEQVQELEQNLLRPLGPERPTATPSRLEVKHYLGVQLLRDIDAMSMAHSLEVRVPLVDHVLSETLWPRLGYFPGLLKNKKLLYASLRRPLPPAVFNRPKQGFTFPFARWIKHDLKDFVREGHRYLADGGWISRQIPEQLQTGFAAGLVHWSRLWSLAIFGQMAMRGPK
jgi:asparagine synthase (glutamine-hydrolysing)